jgi:tetratricopeptide (TPR) repeat protein
MKKIFLLFLAVSLSAGVAFAQEQTPEEMLNSAIELANSGNEAFEAGSPDLALEAFQQSMQMALNAGETGAAHVETCKTAICNIYMKMAKDAYRAKEWDKAVELFNKTKEVATEYGNADVATEAESLIGNTKANQLGTLAAEAKKLKDYATAASYYKQMVEMDPTNGAFALQLGDSYYR